MKQFLHFSIPPSILTNGSNSWSNDRDRHSNSIITTFTIRSTQNTLYLYFRPRLALSLRTFVVMCCITKQRTIRIINSCGNTWLKDKSINSKPGNIGDENNIMLGRCRANHYKELLQFSQTKGVRSREIIVHILYTAKNTMTFEATFHNKNPSSSFYDSERKTKSN